MVTRAIVCFGDTLIVTPKKHDTETREETTDKLSLTVFTLYLRMWYQWGVVCVREK